MSMNVICAIAFFLAGCIPHGADVTVNASIKDYFRMPMAEQIKEFKNHNLEEQYQLFLYGNQVVHPPAIYLAQPFAEQGPTIVPFLREKLGSAKDEATIRDIAQVFSELARLKLYDFSADGALMELLDKRASQMKGMWKDSTLVIIARIRAAPH